MAHVRPGAGQRLAEGSARSVAERDEGGADRQTGPRREREQVDDVGELVVEPCLGDRLPSGAR